MKSWIEISAARLKANFAAVQAVAGLDFEVLALIKADAYGHGAELCAPVLVEAGARWLGVGDLEEGVRVRGALFEAGLAERKTNLVVMCGFEPQDAAGIVELGLTPVVWTEAHVEALERAAVSAKKRVRVHLEVDTGMARQGAVPGPDLDGVVAAFKRASSVDCEGVFSHLSCSEVVGSAQTAKQFAGWREALRSVIGAALPVQYVHLANSSALDEGGTTAGVELAAVETISTGLVRPGLALYGYVLPLERADDAKGPALAGKIGRVAEWKTRVIGVRQIAAGDTVGYGATFVANEPMRLALLPVGYADGFRREASSGVGDGWVMIAGRRASVVGRVSMNLTVVDVTEHEAVRVGDEVVLLGEGVTADDHAGWCGTISYEILCGMRGDRRLV